MYKLSCLTKYLNRETNKKKSDSDTDSVDKSCYVSFDILKVCHLRDLMRDISIEYILCNGISRVIPLSY